MKKNLYSIIILCCVFTQTNYQGWQQPSAKTMLQLYCQQGQVVLQETITAGILSQSIYVWLLPQELYMIWHQADKESITNSFLKQ